MAEAGRVNRAGAAVTMLGPGPEDLELIGYNLMAPERRAAVLETSRRTSLAALHAPARPGEEQRREVTAAGSDPRSIDLRRPVVDVARAERGRLIDVDAATRDDPPGKPSTEIGGERA